MLVASNGGVKGVKCYPLPSTWRVMQLMVKNPPAMWEIQVLSLGREDPLEKGMDAHSSILAWRIPWTEEPGGYSPWSRRESDTTE